MATTSSPEPDSLVREITVETAGYRWLKAESVAREWSAATVQTYRAQLDAFASDFGSKRPVSDIDVAAVEGWILDNVAPATRRQRRKVLSQWCRWLVQQGHHHTDPTVGVGLAKGRAGVAPPGTLFSANLKLLRGYRDDMRRRGLRQSTSLRYRDTLLLWLAWLGQQRAVDATEAQVELWLDSRRLGDRTRYAFVSTLSGFYRWAMRAGLATHDPTADIIRPRIRPGLPRPIPTEDLQYAIAQADQRMRLWLLLAAYQGLRCHEIAGLDSPAVMFDRLPPLLLVADGKGGRQRVLPLHPDVRAAVLAFERPPAGPLFTTKFGNRFLAATVSHFINGHLRDCGINATAHQLRHWFGTEVYAASRDLRLTQELLGHASPVTTSIYAAWSPGDAVDVVTALTARDQLRREHDGGDR